MEQPEIRVRERRAARASGQKKDAIACRRSLRDGAPRLQPATDATLFPTLDAEELAAEFLERDPARPTDAKLQRTPLANVWSLPSADRTVVALFREDRLRAELATALGALALPDVRVSVLAPGESFAANKSLAPQDAGEFLPDWRLGLSFKGDDPFAAASARQARFYLWTGFAVVVVIALIALLVARYVGAQMRLARLKNELVSTVSHELKTPLASMRALVDTLAAGSYRDERQLRDYLDLIAKENVRLSHLIDNFLTFSRLERGQQSFRFEALDPAQVVADAVSALQEKLGAAQCSFASQIEPGLPLIRGDADALSSVLINLLDNAVKYTNGNKRIGVRVYAANGRASSPAAAELVGRKEAQAGTKRNPPFFASLCAFLRPHPASAENVGTVVFEITDNGIGFERSEAKKIFERFYQVDQSLTRQRGGCGLGLGIVQQIVRAHDGDVQVESEPGKGSVFRVRIPHATLNVQPSTLNAHVRAENRRVET